MLVDIRRWFTLKLDLADTACIYRIFDFFLRLCLLLLGHIDYEHRGGNLYLVFLAPYYRWLLLCRGMKLADEEQGLFIRSEGKPLHRKQ